MSKPTKKEVFSVLDNSYASMTEIRDRLRQRRELADPLKEKGIRYYIALFRDISINSLGSIMNELVREGLASYNVQNLNAGYDSAGAVTIESYSYRRKDPTTHLEDGDKVATQACLAIS